MVKKVHSNEEFLILAAINIQKLKKITQLKKYYLTKWYLFYDVGCEVKGLITCDGTKCIRLSARCDGRQDCHDNSDEEDCDINAATSKE